MPCCCTGVCCGGLGPRLWHGQRWEQQADRAAVAAQRQVRWHRRGGYERECCVPVAMSMRHEVWLGSLESYSVVCAREIDQQSDDASGLMGIWYNLGLWLP